MCMNNFWLDLRQKRLSESKKNGVKKLYYKELWRYVAKILANRKKP